MLIKINHHHANQVNYSSSSTKSSDNELIQDSRDLPPIENDSEDEEEYYNILKLVSSKLQNIDESLFNYKNTNIKSKKDFETLFNL